MMAGVNTYLAKRALRTAPRGVRDTSVSVEVVVVVVAVWSGPSGGGDDAARSGGCGEDCSC